MRRLAFSGSVAFAVCFVLGAIGQGLLHAGQYQFTTIADSSDARFSSFVYNGTPAVNNDGTVVFMAKLTDGNYSILIGSGGELTTLVDTSGQFDAFLPRTDFRYEEISINSAGTVAFRATLDTDEYGVFTVNAGGTITTIADSNGRFFNDFRGVSINDAGAVAFYAERWADTGGLGTTFDGVYVGQGGPLTTIAELRVSPDPQNGVKPLLPYQQPSINNNGEVAFFAEYEGGTGIFVGDGGSLTRIVDTESDFDHFIPEARCPINDAGTVAFLAVNPAEYGVYTHSGDAIAAVVENADDYVPNSSDFCDVMINSKGQLAFGGLKNVAAFPRGIYTGADPDADKVIAIGDLLDGSPVSNVYFYGQGLNDRGQIAFYAVTQARAGIYLATPVPEPAASLLLILGAVPLILRRRAA